MSVQVIDNFKLLKAKPLDDRLVINNLSDIPPYARYEGMLVYQLSDEEFYKFKQGVFVLLNTSGGSGGGGASTTVNSRSGNVWLVQGTGVSIVEISPGTFRFSFNNNILLTDGSVQMVEGYIPLAPRDLITKEYLEQELATLITQPQADQIITDLAGKLDETHSNTVASATTLGHAKIDDESIRKTPDDKLYLALTDGGNF